MLVVLPGAVMGCLPFNSGGFYSGPTAYVAAVFCPDVAAYGQRDTARLADGRAYAL
jgi:hypothetical protein